MGVKSTDRDWAPLVCGLLAALLVIVLSLQWWDLRIFGTVIDYQHAGTWAQMLSGVGTTSAVALTLAGLWLERRKRHKELAEARDRELTRVHAWLTPRESKNGPEWFLNFENHTAVPIYRWRVLLAGKDPHLCNVLFGPIRPDKSELHLASLRGMNHVDYPTTTFYFTTGDGRTWALGADGGAIEVSDQNVQCDKDH